MVLRLVVSHKGVALIQPSLQNLIKLEYNPLWQMTSMILTKSNTNGVGQIRMLNTIQHQTIIIMF